ncbi:MAG: MmgE/PrpD family protein [Rhodospirillaceae bacterium]|nr:MmgE/PrpD family protein [Rhodospirillaceae bacterium]
MANKYIAAQTLGKSAASTRWSILPTSVRSMTLDLFADTIGVIAGGSEHPSMQSLMASTKATEGPATLIGEKRGVTARDAVLLNAATTTVLQRQDGYAHAKGHPASQLVPVVLALAESRGKTAEDMLTAMVAGYEVAARVGIALGGVPAWLHDNGNWVTIGNTVAAAHILSSGDADAIATAIDGAASLALSFDRFTTAGGATMHHMYPAMATTQALAIAEGAIAGLTALPGSLERFYGPHLGTAFDALKLHDGIDDGTWSQFEILNGYFKLHPSCAHLHGVNDAVDALIAEHEVTEANIVRVDISTFGEAMEIDTDTPTNDLAARFSAKATVAAALRYGSLNDEGLLDLNALAPLMEKITARHDPELDQYTPAGRPGVVTMGLTSGHKVTKEIIYPRGTAQTLATPDERKAKSLMLLTRHYGEEKAHGIHDTIMSLGNEGEIEALTSSLRA